MSEASSAGPAVRRRNSSRCWSARPRRSRLFEEEQLTSLQRLQRFLHVYPTTVPFVVLVLGLLLGVAVNPSRFTAASNFSTDPDPGDGHRHSRHRTDAGDPDRRHRPVDRRHHGDLVGRDGPPRGVRRRSDHPRLPARPPLRRVLRLPQRRAGDAHADAAVHRHPRHAVDHRRAQHLLFAERNDRHAGHRGQAPISCKSWAISSRSAARASCGAPSSCC